MEDDRITIKEVTGYLKNRICMWHEVKSQCSRLGTHLDALLKILNHAKQNGSRHNYLHSSGSGKSNTIGWTAHRPITLHDDSDQPVFNTAIIVTDRVVPDHQLQNIVMTDAAAREQAIKHFFSRALREVRNPQ